MRYLATVTDLVAPGKMAVIDSFTEATPQAAYKRARSIARSIRDNLGFTTWQIYRITDRESAMPFLVGGPTPERIHVEMIASDRLRFPQQPSRRTTAVVGAGDGRMPPVRPRNYGASNG